MNAAFYKKIKTSSGRDQNTKIETQGGYWACTGMKNCSPVLDFNISLSP